MKFFTKYLRPEPKGTINLEPSMTQQQFAESANINSIINKYRKTGVMPVVPKNTQPIYGDFTGIKEFQEAQGVIAHATQQFEELPKNIKDRFHNDPSELLEFCSNEENRPEAERLGIVPKPAEKPKTEPVKPADSIPTT